MQVRPELEEAARSVGASRGQVTRHVTLPLVPTGLLASWLLVFMIFEREYSSNCNKARWFRCWARRAVARPRCCVRWPGWRCRIAARSGSPTGRCSSARRTTRCRPRRATWGWCSSRMPCGRTRRCLITRPRSLSDLGRRSEVWPQRGQFLSDLQPIAVATGAKGRRSRRAANQKWTAAAKLQPTFPKSDRLPGADVAQGCHRRNPGAGQHGPRHPRPGHTERAAAAPVVGRPAAARGDRSVLRQSVARRWAAGLCGPSRRAVPTMPCTSLAPRKSASY